ncbi:MAG: ABC transporter ATP-binding protein [Proteobacteria bacterium]|nr:MAG: ABC transporter ATP-binding protein [Pseudomonadota bacterium]QKK12033.1 MAG: ABC transporter ATP-binding protein [Pseudomonadota bacterium]
MSDATTPLLAAHYVSKSFSGLRAVADVSFEVVRNSVTALIGPNGAGKTTVFNLISGVCRPDSGHVELDGQSVMSLRPDQICRAGVGRTFQIAKPFGDLSVADNVAIGALSTTSSVKEARRRTRRILELLELGEESDKPAHSLTLPGRKRLEVARALATEPKILLLDEVMAGLRPTETDRMVEILRELNRSTGLTILLIEHVMRAVMALSERVVVLNHGKTICIGTPQEVVKDPQVLECYLGEEAPQC